VTVRLTGHSLTLDEVVQVARDGAAVLLDDDAADRMAATRAVVERALASGRVVYGMTTGVGAKKAATVDEASAAAHSRLLVLNHRVGQGPLLPQDVVRAALLRLANHLASGAPGVRPELARALIDALNRGVTPDVRSLGSIGVADLSANADLVDGALVDVPLAAGEGIALLNHNAVATGYAALALADTAAFVDTLEVAGALDVEAFAANVSVLDPAIDEARPFPGLVESRRRIAAALEGSAVWTAAARNLQDPLCFRCLPQVHGAARDALRFALDRLAVELNAHQGNPLVVDGDGERVVAVGNFDMLPLAGALDLVRIALAPVLTAAVERTVKLLQRPLSGLPEGLAVRAGLAEDGLAEFGIAAQALVAEARLLAEPVSFHVVSTTQAEGIEDRMTMVPLGARRLAEIRELGCRIVAIELVVASQAVDLRGARPLGRGTAEAHARVRELVAPLAEGAPIPLDLEPVAQLVRSGSIG